MENLEDVFKIIKFENFITGYTDIPIGGGIKNRKTGKGTNSSDKQTTYRPHEIEEMKAGLAKLSKDINQAIKKIKNGNKV